MSQQAPVNRFWDHFGPTAATLVAVLAAWTITGVVAMIITSEWNQWCLFLGVLVASLSGLVGVTVATFVLMNRYLDQHKDELKLRLEMERVPKEGQ